VGIHDGTAGQMDIDAARQSWLTDYDDIKKAQDLYNAKSEDIRLFAEAVDALGNDNYVWTGGEKDKKLLNRLVGDEGRQAIMAGDEGYITQAIVPLVNRTDMIPSSVVDLLAGMSRSSDSTRAMFALDALSQLQDVNPRA